MIRKKKFGISLKLSLIVGLIVVISFVFIFAFFQKTQRFELEKKMLSELSLIVQNLKQDINNNYFIPLEEGGALGLDKLAEKFSSFYQESLSDEDRLLLFKEIALVKRSGTILANNQKIMYGNNAPFLKTSRKRNFLKSDFNNFLEGWKQVQNPLSKEDAFYKGVHNSSYSIYPLFHNIEPNINGRKLESLKIFLSYLKKQKNQQVFNNIRLNPFFLESLNFFFDLWENRVYMQGQIRVLVQLRRERSRIYNRLSQLRAAEKSILNQNQIKTLKEKLKDINKNIRTLRARHKSFELTGQGTDLIERYKEIIKKERKKARLLRRRRRYRRRRSKRKTEEKTQEILIPKKEKSLALFRNLKGDFEFIQRSLIGIYYLTEEYWFKRISQIKAMDAALEKMQAIIDKNDLGSTLTRIKTILAENQDKNYEDWNAKLIIATIHLKKLYRQELNSLEKLFPKSHRGIFTFIKQVTELSDKLESLQNSKKNFNRLINHTLKSLDSYTSKKGLENKLAKMKTRLKDYLEVNLKEQSSWISKSILIRSIHSLYKIELFSYYKKSTDAEFEEIKKKLQEKRDFRINLIKNNGLFLKPIDFMQDKKDYLGRKDEKEISAFFFLIYLHRHLELFKYNDGSKTPYWGPKSSTRLGNYFFESDLKRTESIAKQLRSFFKNLYNNPDLKTRKSSFIQLKNKTLSFKESFLSNMFINLFRRYHGGYLVVRLSEDKINKAVHKSLNSLIDLGLNLLIRFIFIAVLFSLFFLRKFKTLFKGVELIGEGNLTHQIKIAGSDEFGQLADHVNLMGNNLNNAQQDLIEKSRMQEELEIAKNIQQTLLPKEMPDINAVSYASYYNAQTETGGDYFDFVKIDDENLALVIADVAGHGVGACLVMSMIRTLVRSYAQKIKNPKEVIVRINDYIQQNTPSNMYSTLFYAIYNTESKKLIYSIAGHNAAILYNPKTKKIRTLAVGGMAAGLIPSATFKNIIKNYQVDMEEGEIFIQYTDGVTEAENEAKEQYEMERLLEAVGSFTKNDITELFSYIIEDIESFTKGYIQADDITMMGIQIKGDS